MLIFPDHSFYEGEFKDEKYHGEGIYRWEDGLIYEG